MSASPPGDGPGNSRPRPVPPAAPSAPETPPPPPAPPTQEAPPAPETNDPHATRAPGDPYPTCSGLALPGTRDPRDEGAVPGSDGPTGPRVAGYEILRVLGRGGMGVVYQARHRALNRLVALKMILAGGHAGDGERQRFLTEAEAVARLQHPNIVQIYEIGEADGQPFFTLEFVPGGSLAGKLGGTPLPAQEAARLVEQLARGVHFAHGKGVIHRDLKPANILLADDGTPRVTDFGLAKRVEVGDGLTASGAILGTPSYMAPEQARGQVNEVGPPADVYALGAVLYECLTGRPPFRASSVMDTLEQVCLADPVPPSRLQPRVPRDLDTICLKCLQKEAPRRYGSAGSLADDLGRFLDGRPIQARPVGPWERARKWVRRRPAVAALALSTLLTALVGFGLVTWKWLEADNARARTAQALLNEEGQRREADRLRAAAEEAAGLFQRAAYDSSLARVGDEWARGNPGQVEQLLSQCRPAVRGWDWYYWQRRLRAPLRTFRADASGVNRLAVSPDGRFLATAGGNILQPDVRGWLRVWDLAADQLLLSCQHCYPVSDAAYSPDGRHLASASTWLDVKAGMQVGRMFATPPRGEIKVWDAFTGKEVWAADGFGCVAFSPDGKWVVAGGPGPKITIRDRATGSPLATLDLGKGRGWPSTLRFSPDGKQLLVSSVDTPEPHKMSQALTLWDVARRAPAGFTLDGAEPPAVFSPDGATVATAGAGEAILLWDARTGKQRLALRGHGGSVGGLRYSADGKLLASYGNHLIHLWDAQQGRELSRLVGHNGDVRDLVFVPGRGVGGRRLLSCGEDGIVQLWDPDPGQEPLALQAHPGLVNSLAFSPDGRLLASGGGTDRLVRIQDARTGQEVARLPDCPATIVAFSPDGQTLAIGCRPIGLGDEKGELLLWKWASGQAPVRLAGHTRAVLRLAFRGDGLALVSASGTAVDGRPGEVILWDLPSGTRKATVPTPQQLASGVAFSPDGRWLAVDDTGGRLRLCDGGTGAVVREWQGHREGIVGLAFNPKGAQGDRGVEMASLDVDGQALIWEAPTGRVVFGFRTPRSGLLTAQPLAYSPDGERLVSVHTTLLGEGSELHLWNVRTGQRLLTLPALMTATFSPDGHRLAAVAPGRLLDAGLVHIWDGTPGPEVFSLDAGQGAVQGIAADAGGRLLAAGHTNGALVLWDAREGRELHGLIRHTDAVASVAMSKDGRLLAGGGTDGSVRVWELADGRERHRLVGHEGVVIDVAFSPDGKWLASGGADKTVRVWDVETGKEEARLEGHTACVRALAFGPASDEGPPLLASSGEERAIRLWDVREKRTIRTMQPGGVAYGLTFSPDGTLLASAAGDGVVALWDVNTGQLRRQLRRLGLKTQATMTVALSGWSVGGGSWLALGPLHTVTFQGHSREAYAVAFNPGGKVLASGGRDGVIRLWDVATGCEMATLRGHADAVWGVAFTASGTQLVSGSLDGTVKVWQVKTGPQGTLMSSDPAPASVLGNLAH